MEPGYIGTYIACSPSKKDEALSGMQKVLEGLAAKGPTAQEMDRAREYYLGRRAMDLQGDGALASYYSLESIYGLPLLTQAEVLERVRAVTPKEIQRLCRKYLVEAPKVTAVVG
jgi:predicted Zn-dependent peptidase